MRSFFVTGTDTECGKTRVSCALIRALREKGQTIAPMKPIASGAESVDGGLRNADAVDLIAAASGDWPYARVNRYIFEPPIAPHLAAREADVRIDPEEVREDFDWLRERSDRVVVEGVGGWAVPLSEELMLADLVRVLQLPVVVVIGMKLGCLNHGLLTVRRILDDGFPLIGWIANRIDPEMLRYEDNLATLERVIPVPRIATLEHGATELEIEAVL
ncbi:MAG: dethiobiotin synthase [Xanthomonadales bacterium]|nr:dethiobiotin synthase [Xanthomonadales bacterium]